MTVSYYTLVFAASVKISDLHFEAHEVRRHLACGDASSAHKSANYALGVIDSIIHNLSGARAQLLSIAEASGA